MMRKKRIYTVAAVCLLVLLYIMIFLLSSDVAEDSSVKSSAVTEFLLKIWGFFQNSDGTGTPTTEAAVDLFPLELEKIVRKVAHFSEYFCVGLLSYSLVLLWWKGKVWSGRVLIGMQLLLSASLDEIHQYFVPGRYAAVKDVLIDCAGGITGMVILRMVFAIRKYKRYKKSPVLFK